MSPREETPAGPLTQEVGKFLPIKISNGEYFVVEDILISANMAGSISGHFEACILDLRLLAYERNLFEGTEKVLVETVTCRVAFFNEGLFWHISNMSLKLV